MIVDLVRNLEQAVYLDFRVLSNKPRSVNALQDLAHESMSHFGRRRSVLEDVTNRLRLGASALRAAAARDNAYYQQVSSLQRFWKVNSSHDCQHELRNLKPVALRFAPAPPQPCNIRVCRQPVLRGHQPCGRRPGSCRNEGRGGSRHLEQIV